MISYRSGIACWFAFFVIRGQAMGHETYKLTDIYNGSNFFSQFTFFTDSDPTQGFVQYVDAHTALTSGLARSMDNNQVYLGVDNSSILDTPDNSTIGRKSIRLESRDAFDRGVLIADFAHIPSGVCGTWPAYWTYNYDEDPYGEIDIIEGVNDQIGDDISLHTSAKCRLNTDSSAQSGTDMRTDCSLATNYVDGCGVSGLSNSYGDSFNSQGGGVWALSLDQNNILIWIFPRTAVPKDIANREELISKDWGIPLLNFTSHKGCRVGEQWKHQTIIFNIDFCGENAGGTNWIESSTASSQSCAESTGFATCEAYVAANPQAFADSYFLINSVKLYQTLPNISDEFSNKGIPSVRRSPNYTIWLVAGWLVVAGVEYLSCLV